MSRGVSRVVDTTWLDRIGIPVYASIRPDGVNGSLCVHAGKGFTHAEAKIGAYMEAIEFSFAPPGRSHVQWRFDKPQSVVASFHDGIQFRDFCARLGRTVKASDEIAVVDAEELMAGLGRVLLPAELVYHPFFEEHGLKLYGSTTNGLASGNTVEEATVHGLAEVMERDVRSFDNIVDRSVLVNLEGAPPKVRSMANRVQDAGFPCYLRYSENAFGMAYFTAYLFEVDEEAPIPVASGFGFHPVAEIAAVRAIAEAVQGRLSFIHGGRDDLIKRFLFAEAEGRESELAQIRRLRQRASSDAMRMGFGEVPDFAAEIATIKEAQDCMFDGLRRAGLNHVARVVFTEPGYPFQIVRIVVPGAEMYEAELRRVGPRLMGFFKGLNRHV